MKINNEIIKRTVGKTGLYLRKHAPEIMSAVGGAGVIAATVLACKATLKAKEVLEENKEDLDDIHEARELCDKEKYTDTDYKRDLAQYYGVVGVKIAKAYAPAVILGGLSLGAMFASNSILRKRNASLAAAYATLESIYKKYRKNVIDTYGEEVDKNMRYGIKTEKVEEIVTDENGKTKKTKTEKKVVDGVSVSDFARFFDKENDLFSYDKVSGYAHTDYNLMFLKSQQAYANNILKSRGYLFLNEVYHMLGFPMTKAGQSAGWIYRKDATDDADNYVDFNIMKLNRHVMDGLEEVILVDFNVEGNILESPDLKIWSK